MRSRVMSCELRVNKTGSQPGRVPFTVHCSLLTVFLLLTSHFPLLTSAADAKWSGVDESVVEKYAEEHGRAPKDSVINTDQGDILLFFFLLGGAVGGFAAGYYWRQLTEKKDNRPHSVERQKGI